MAKEDKDTPRQRWEYIELKRKRVNASEGDIADRTKQILEDSFLFNNSSSTTSDQTDSKLKMFWTISKNTGLLESNGLRKIQSSMELSKHPLLIVTDMFGLMEIE
ncbi:unnamed protein product [Phytophthora lilii]|uniref:Unnamed protein product n=1 Tax=Phytophthora lilii TaxID=2077276 RepID=A0A9W6TKL9_9STRA|nr:unnamed protein product [Phytophthora lilii]